MFGKITRRALAAGTSVLATSTAFARRFAGGGLPIAQTITAVNLSGNTFLGGAGSAGSVIGIATVTLSPGSPAPSGVVWSITGTDAARFLINSSTGVLSVGGSDQAVGSYSINVIATRAGYVGSPFTQPETITGSSSMLTTNVNATRPLGPVFSGSFGDPRASNDYPFANVIAQVTGGPGNPGDYLVFWSSATGEASQRWYLNNSSTPPGSGIFNASGLQVPSVPGFPTWNPANTFPPTPPVTAFTLRFVNGNTSAVIASVPITIDILKRTSVFPQVQQIGLNHTPTVMNPHINSGGIGGASTCPIVAGTIGIDTFFSIESAFVPALNSITIQYTVDDIPIGGLIVGPASLVMPEWASSINTVSVSWNSGTGIPDGTHVLGLIVVDATGGAAATFSLPYYFRSLQIPFIVHNTGTSLATLYASPQQIPTYDRGNAPGIRVNSSRVDFVTWPGFPAVVSAGGTHNTVVPIPLPQSGVIPPASDPASPIHSFSPTAQRASTVWFTEGICGANPTEYITMQRFFTTVDGGIYAYGYNAEQGQTLEGDYLSTIRHFNFDGSRNDCIPDQMSSGIPGHDGTYWIVFEMFGRIVKITHDGTLTTVAGGTTDRTKVGLCNDDANYTESQIDPFLIQHGTIVSPTFGDLRGINLGCWDLTDAVPGNSLLVANPIDHYIAKVTGLAAGHGPVTMFRIVGQDGGIGGAQVNPADNGGMVDGPATEFVNLGTSTVATRPSGSISGTVFTEGAGGSGSFSIGCPLHGAGVTVGTLIISAAGAGTWNINISQTVGTETITGSTPVAQLAGPYSVDMADGIVGPDQKGTLYIADYQNSRIVRVEYNSLAQQWTTVTTLFGNQTGTIRWGSAGPFVGSPIGALMSASSPITITLASWSANVLTVQTASPVMQSGVDSQYGTISPGWNVTLAGLTNTGAGGNSQVNGNFNVLAVTDNQHFTITMPAGAGIGTIGGAGTLVYWADDVYLPVSTTGTPRAINPGGPHEAYIPLPQRAVINSTGKLVISSTWFDAVVTVNLVGPTIVYTSQYGCDQPNTRLATNGSHGRPSLNFQISWFQIDVDRGVAGDVSSIGCVGPKDDIFFLDANGNVMGTYWRASADGSSFLGDIGSNDMIRSQPVPVGRQGIGHYNWMVAISRHQGRVLTSGLSDGGVSAWRIIDPAHGDFHTETSNNTNADGAALQRGYINLLQGTLAGLITTSIAYPFPWGTRPGIYQTCGEGLRSNLIGGTGKPDTIDGWQANYPTDAALTTFLQGGGGGVVPAPEFTGDDLNDILYTIRRTSAQGSIPGGTAGGGFTPINPLVQPGPYATDTTAPVIVIDAVGRTGGGATTINIQWHTDKPTWGIVCAGFASAHGTTAPYHLFAREPFVAGAGNPSYATTGHNVTIQCYKDVLTYVAVVAKDVAGNNVVSAEQTVAA